jgi:hypothetical protein
MDPSLSDMVTQGANRVGERGEATPLAAVGFVAAVALTVVVLRARRSRPVMGAAVVAVLAGAVPGLSTIQERRADSLAHAPLAAAVIERFRGDVERFSDAHGCAVVTKSACAACDPIVDFALATSGTCRAPAPIVLGEDALTAGCTDVSGTLMCGGRARAL